MQVNTFTTEELVKAVIAERLHEAEQERRVRRATEQDEASQAAARAGGRVRRPAAWMRPWFKARHGDAG